MLLQLFLLLLSSGVDSQAQQVSGQQKAGVCQCKINSSMWVFPAARFESALQQVDTCEGSLGQLQEQILLSSERLPHMQLQVDNVTARLEPFQYLHNRGLYTALSLRQLGQELTQLETDVTAIHSRLNLTQQQTLSAEVGKLRKDVKKMKLSDTNNMKTVKERLRYLKNNIASCKSIPQDFRAQHTYCLKGLITNISSPVTTKISPYGKSYISGSWGKQAKINNEGQQDNYWIQHLPSNHIHGNVLRVYPTYGDFMDSTNHRDFTFAPSHTDRNTIEGPSAVLYGEALYYHCYRSADVCRYDLKTNGVKRATLPGNGVGFNNKFPYCYYDCRSHSDVDLEADETGLWAIYATVGNHGNLVLSRLVWGDKDQTLNVSQTWETRVFKKAVTNAFMVCGVLYATRYVDEYKEEVFYAFDTATGKETNSLALPLEKVAKGVASLSYNPTNRQIYMYNDAYLLAYQAFF